MLEEKYKLYHYSAKTRTELLTLREQINRGIITDKKDIKNINDMDAWYIRKDGVPYSEHISLHIDPLPVDLIIEHFPPESPYFKGKGTVIEHVIDMRVLAADIRWMVVESPIDNFLVDTIWFDSLFSNSNAAKLLHFKIKKYAAKLAGNSRSGNIALIGKVNSLKGHIRKWFLEWIEKEDFLDTARQQYAPGVPHIHAYPPKGSIAVISARVIKLKQP